MVVNAFVDAIQLGTNVARIRKIIGDMIELVTRHRQLQPREHQHRQPCGAMQSAWTNQYVQVLLHVGLLSRGKGTIGNS